MREYHKRGNIALKLGKIKSKIRWFVELSCVCVCVNLMIMRGLWPNIKVDV